MRRLSILILTMAVFMMAARPADAQALPVLPKPALRHRVADKKFWLMAALAIGSAVATTATIHRCRQDHGIGPCVGGDYGPFPAKESIRLSVTGGLVAVSYFWKRLDDEQGTRPALWWTFPMGAIALNGGTIARNQLRTFGPREQAEQVPVPAMLRP